MGKRPSPTDQPLVRRAAVKAELDALEERLDELDHQSSIIGARIRGMIDDWHIAPANQWHDTRWIRLCIEVLAGVDDETERKIWAAARYGSNRGIQFLKDDLIYFLRGMIALREAEERRAR